MIQPARLEDSLRYLLQVCRGAAAFVRGSGPGQRPTSVLTKFNSARRARALACGARSSRFDSFQAHHQACAYPAAVESRRDRRALRAAARKAYLKRHPALRRSTGADLGANRSGHISVRQRVHLLWSVVGSLFLALIGLVIVVAIGPNLVGAWQQDWLTGAAATALLLVGAAMCLAVLLAGAEIADVVVGSARTAEGTAAPAGTSSSPAVDAFTDVVVTANTGIPYQSSHSGTLGVTVDGQQFEVDAAAFDALTHANRPVHVYYARYSGHLLSYDTAPPA